MPARFEFAAGYFLGGLGSPSRGLTCSPIARLPAPFNGPTRPDPAASSLWPSCFRRIRAVSAFIPPEDDVYLPDESLDNPDWVKGPEQAAAGCVLRQTIRTSTSVSKEAHMAYVANKRPTNF